MDGKCPLGRSAQLSCQVARQRCAGEQNASQTECLLLAHDFTHRDAAKCRKLGGGPDLSAC